MKLSTLSFAAFLFCTTQSLSTDAAVVTFDFISPTGNGNDLNGLESGTTSASDGGIVLTLDATATVVGGSGEFNRNGTSGSDLDFGINAAGSGDVTDALDDGIGIEAMAFTVTSSVLLSNLEIQSIDLDRFTNAGGDAVRIAINGESGTVFTSADATNSTSGLLTLNQALNTGDTFSLEFAAGTAGFGLEFITFSATAVPEPSCLAVLGIIAFGIGIRTLDRKSRCSANCYQR